MSRLLLFLLLSTSLLIIRGQGLAANTAEYPAKPLTELTGGFAETVFDQTTETGQVALREAKCWDSRQGDDNRTGTFFYGPFAAPPILELFVAGFPGEPGRSLKLVRDEDGSELILRTRSAPGSDWVRLRWDLPASWQGSRVHLRAEDQSQGPGGWVGLSQPLRPSWRILSAFKLSGLQTLAWLVILLPGLALAPWLKRMDPARLLIHILIVSALSAYLIFFLSFANPLFGRIGAWTLLSGSLVSLLISHLRVLDLLREKEFSLPLLFSLLAALFACLGCFLYGGVESASGIPANRILFGLPSDPLIPRDHANLLAAGAPLRPFFLDWLTSDRPPLQAGLSLLGRPLITGDLGYLCVGMAAQSWVWLGFWVFLRRLGAQARAVCLVLGVSLFSGFFFLNTLFCWPKLLPAAFLLCCAGLLWGRDRRDPVPVPAAILAGLCAGLALLGHGGSIFGLAGIILVYLGSRRRLNKAMLLAPALAGFATLSPWFAYQHFYDPPGDRLIKYHLAGREAIDPRPSLTVIAEAYRQTPLETVVTNKLRNLQNQVFERAYWYSNTCNAGALLLQNKTLEAFTLFGRASREAGFYHYGQTLGPLLLGLLGLPWLLWKRRDSNEARVAGLSALLFLASVLVWSLLMFPRDSAIIHQSSYFTGACLFASVGLGLSVLPRRLLQALLVLNVLWFILVWLIAQPLLNFGLPLNLLGSSFPGYRLVWALVAAGAIAVLLRLSRSGENHSDLNH